MPIKGCFGNLGEREKKATGCSSRDWIQMKHEKQNNTPIFSEKAVRRNVSEWSWVAR
jgi:hypothetical protein